MPVQMPTPEHMAEVTAILQADYEAARKAATPELVNNSSVLDLGTERAIEYRGRRYIARPISYRDGIRIQELMHRLYEVEGKTSEAEAREALLGFFTDAGRLCGELLRPGDWRGRLRRRLERLLGLRSWNPFADANEGDLVTLLASFHLCRTKLTVRSAFRHSRPEGVRGAT